jgi:hypothetical protein
VEQASAQDSTGRSYWELHLGLALRTTGALLGTTGRHWDNTGRSTQSYSAKAGTAPRNSTGRCTWAPLGLALGER